MTQLNPSDLELDDEPQNDSAESESEPGSSPDSTPSPTAGSDPTPSSPRSDGSSSPFDAAHLQAQFETLKSQNAALQRQLREMQNPPAPPEAPPSKDDFFDDPVNAINKILSHQLKSVVAPIQADLDRNKTEANYEQLMTNHPAARNMRSSIEQLAAQSNMKNPTYDQLRGLFFMLRGLEIESGGGGESSAPTPQSPAPPQPLNPQHRSSTQPLVSGTPQQKVRKLTEEEEHFRKMHGLTREQYIKMQEADSADFLTVEGS